MAVAGSRQCTDWYDETKSGLIWLHEWSCRLVVWSLAGASITPPTTALDNSPVSALGLRISVVNLEYVFDRPSSRLTLSCYWSLPQLANARWADGVYWDSLKWKGNEQVLWEAFRGIAQKQVASHHSISMKRPICPYVMVLFLGARQSGAVPTEPQQWSWSGFLRIFVILPCRTTRKTRRPRSELLLRKEISSWSC